MAHKGSMKRPGWESTRGTKARNAKLTEQDVIDIRSSKLSSKFLAQQYNVCVDTINRVKRKATYK